MIEDIIITFLISISPFGEGKVGIPWGIDKAGLAKEIALLVGLSANLLVFPLFYRSINFLNKNLLKYKWYKNNNLN